MSSKDSATFPSKRSSIRKIHYDKISKWYDLLAFPEKEHVKRGLKYLNVKNGEKILEIGFGTGEALLILSKQVGDTGKVYGIDISSEMTRIATSKLKKASLLERTNLMVGDALKLPFEEEFFDAIFMSFTLELFLDFEISTLLKQCKGILKDEGRLVVVSLSKKGSNKIIRNIYEWFNHKFPTYVDCRLINSKKKIEEANFKVYESEKESMYGLAVDIVLAIK